MKLMCLIFFGSIFLSINNASNAQKVDFSGSWNFKEQKSISGLLYDNALPKHISINQSKINVVVEKLSLDVSGIEVTTKDTIRIDQSVQEKLTKYGKRKTIKTEWEGEQKTLVITTEIFSLDDRTKLETKIVDKWTLSDDRKELIILRHNENISSKEIWETRGVYSRE